MPRRRIIRRSEPREPYDPDKFKESYGAGQPFNDDLQDQHRDLHGMLLEVRKEVREIKERLDAQMD